MLDEALPAPEAAACQESFPELLLPTQPFPSPEERGVILQKAIIWTNQEWQRREPRGATAEPEGQAAEQAVAAKAEDQGGQKTKCSAASALWICPRKRKLTWPLGYLHSSLPSPL